MSIGLSAGDLLVRIGADTSRFGQELKQQAEAAASRVTSDVRIGADVSDLTSEVRQAAAQVSRQVDVAVDVNPETTGFTGEVQRAASRVTGGVDLPIDVNPDVTGLAAEVNRAAELATAGVAINVPVVPSVAGVGAQVAAQGTAAGAVAGKGMAAGIGASLVKFGGPAALAGGAFLGVNLAKSSVEAASNLGETTSKVNQIFGPEAAAQLQKFASTADLAFGQTQQQALDAAATFGLFGKIAGLQKAPLATFSSDLTGLASDMASFGNTSVEEAITAVGGALRGETEPIRRFGVMLDADTVAAQALEMGLVKTTVNLDKVAAANKKVQDAQQGVRDAQSKYGADSDEAAVAAEYLAFKQQELGKALKGTADKITPGARVLATQALIMKQTSDQQGDFARTSGGLANQQRILSAQWGNMKAQLGSALLPAVTAVVTKFNEWLPKIIDFGKQVGAFLAPVKDAFTNLFGGGAGEAGGPGEKIAAIGTAFTNLWAVVQPILTQISDALGKAWETVGPVVTETFGYVKEYITSVLGIIAAVIEKVTGVIRIVWEKWGTGITNFVTMVFGKIVGIVSGVMQALSGVVKTVLAVLKGDWSGAWDGLVQVVKGIWKVIYNAVSGGIRAIGGLVDGLWALFKTAGVNVVKGLWAGIGSVAGWLGRKFSEFFSGLPGIVKRIFGIESPSTVMAGFGVQMVRGMVVGMDKQRPDLLRALTRLVPDEPLPIPTLAATGPLRPPQGAATGAVAVPASLLGAVAVGERRTSNVTFETNLYGVPDKELARQAPVEMRKAAFLAGVLG